MFHLVADPTDFIVGCIFFIDDLIPIHHLNSKSSTSIWLNIFNVIGCTYENVSLASFIDPSTNYFIIHSIVY